MQLSDNRIMSMKARLNQDMALLDNREPEYSFTQDEYSARLDQLCERAEADGLETLIISSPDSICWLHGYESRWFKAQSPDGWMPLMMSAVRVATRQIVHFDDYHHRYLLKYKSVAEDLCLSNLDGVERLDEIVGELAGRGWLKGQVGFELGSHVPNPRTSALLQKSCQEKGSVVVDVTTLVRQARQIKSAAEISAIEKAAEICDAGLIAMASEVKPGMTERQAWGILMRGMAEAGGGPAALHESVVVGPIELGHAFASDHVIQAGDVLCADPSGVYKNYHANVERWYVVGEDPSETLVDLARIEAEAFKILSAEAKDGRPVQEVTDMIEDLLKRNSVWGMHNWNGGYELGLSFAPDWVGEWTFTVGEQTSDVFKAGTVTNYESIVIYPMIDTVLFEKDGARTLSKLPHEVTRIA